MCRCKHCELTMKQLLFETRKLKFVSSSKEQLPYPLWDPDMWTEANQLGGGSNQLVYLARGRSSLCSLSSLPSNMVCKHLLHGQQLVLFLGCWQSLARAGSRSACSISHLGCQTLQAGSQYILMRWLMQCVVKQAAPESLTLAPKIYHSCFNLPQNWCPELMLWFLESVLLMGM